jgi:hypothetical protein
VIVLLAVPVGLALGVGVYRVSHPRPAAGGGAAPALPGAATPKALPSGPSDLPAATLTPRAGNPATAQRVRDLDRLLVAAWPKVTGLSTPMPDAARVLADAQAVAEGCLAWGGHNPGCYQCNPPAQGGEHYTCAVHTDTRPDPKNPGGPSIPYETGFRQYDSPEAGAEDFLRSITVKPFPALAELRAGSALDFARALGLAGYFEGFDPDSKNGGSVLDWETRWAPSLAYLARRGGLEKRAAKAKTTPERVAGRIAVYARGIGERAREVAAALGMSTVPVTLPADLAGQTQPKAVA